MDAQEQRQLLELAAKAVGFIDDTTDESEATGLHRGLDDVFYITSSDGWREWTPYADDGDALRLAVSLCAAQDDAVLLLRALRGRHSVGRELIDIARRTCCRADCIRPSMT